MGVEKGGGEVKIFPFYGFCFVAHPTAAHTLGGIIGGRPPASKFCQMSERDSGKSIHCQALPLPYPTIDNE